MPIRHKFERSNGNRTSQGNYNSPPRKPVDPPREPDSPPRKPGCPPREPDNGHGRGSLPPYIDLTEAYVPVQPYTGNTFDLQAALSKGTIYPDLYRPYEGHYWEMR